MAWAVAFWQCIASAVTVQPSSASSAKISGGAVISLPSTLRWPSTSRCAQLQALIRWSGPQPARRSNERRAVLPSTATTCSIRAAKAATKRPKQASNPAGSSSRNRRENVSWLGMPPGSARKRRKNGSFARPNAAMSTQLSAPHHVAPSAISRISSRSCRCALPVRGSARSAKHARNRSMPPLPSRSGQPNQITARKDSTNF